jgi:hypothetical protein
MLWASSGQGNVMVQDDLVQQGLSLLRGKRMG